MSRAFLQFLLVSGFLFSVGALSAQPHGQVGKSPRETAVQYLREHAVELGLTPADVADVRVTDEYASGHNGLTHVWVQQQYAGIPVWNALIGLHVDAAGRVHTAGHRLVDQLAAKINTRLPSLGAAQALELAKADLGLTGIPTPALREKLNDRNLRYDGGLLSRLPIAVSACYEPLEDGRVRLAWALEIQPVGTSDAWSVRIDAQTGAVLEKTNRTVYCRPQSAAAPSPDAAAAGCSDHAVADDSPAGRSENSVDEAYRVFPLPIESPSHGPRQLVVNPALPAASPFGWLDVNGQAGPEYTYTRGNNAWAYDDQANDNTPDPLESATGTNATFDFPYDPAADVAANRLAGITNLFYATNWMHDWAYRFGFDEPAGAYQSNNYGQPGQANDPVRAESLDAEGQNNANFLPNPDGVSGVMQMYKWTGNAANYVRVNAPAAAFGSYPAELPQGWGGALTPAGVTGPVEVVDDGSSDPTLGCEPLLNNLAGKIAMVDRGVCDFSLKALNAQQAGAIGCIVCNFVENSNPMGPGQYGAQVTIPVVRLAKSKCDILRQYAGFGLDVTLLLPPATGPAFLDGAFDNGIITHEYAHGISNRLTGGPSNVGCLQNNEQMGEGWSDFFALAATVRPGDVPEKLRGLYTFALGQPTTGQGIRRYPYSTDTGISPLTFGAVAENTAPHYVGEVWSAMLWDLYWALVEKYGFDADWSNTASGNYRAVQLVMDGLKLQPCSPGFVDGRNAILLADVQNYNGADTCLISTVFARRGLGVGAAQGSTNNAADGVENFDPIPTCIKELKISKKTSTPVINPGGFAAFTITVTNHKDAPANGVIVRDELPAGLTLQTASNGGTAQNGFVEWTLGTMQPGQVTTLTYLTLADPGLGSSRFYYDAMEGPGDWQPVDLDPAPVPGSGFVPVTGDVQAGQFAWQVGSLPVESDFALQYTGMQFVESNEPVLRFWHRYQTEPGNDAGLVEIRRAGTSQWKAVPADKLFRAAYTTRLPYTTFFVPFLSGFNGNSNGWRQTYIDLSEYAGDSIAVRFRFGSNAAVAAPNDAWRLDEVEMLELWNYDGEACVTSTNGDQACAKAPGRGVVVEPVSVATHEPGHARELALTVWPNPATGRAYLRVNQDMDVPVPVVITTADGRLVHEQTAERLRAADVFPLDLRVLPAGAYLVRVGSATSKLIVF